MGNPEGKASKTYSLRITENAFQDIFDITGYIAHIKHQPLNAIRVGDIIFETIDHIALNPLAYRECKEIPTKNKIYRQAVCLSWNIIFKVKSSEIVVLGIIHGSRRASITTNLRKVR